MSPLGEQTAGMPAQAMTTLQGKLLRLNPDGSIPDDNPFYHTARGKYRAIWALGLRNPFTFAVQPGTGRILINDVGQGTWEEVNEGVAGANYGWPMTEGPTSDPRFRGPIHHYSGRLDRRRGVLPVRRSRPASRRSIRASISSWISSGAGSMSSTPIIPQDGRDVRRGSDAAGRPRLQPRRVLLRPAPRRLGRRRQLPPGHRLAAAGSAGSRQAASRPRISSSASRR